MERPKAYLVCGLRVYKYIFVLDVYYLLMSASGSGYFLGSSLVTHDQATESTLSRISQTLTGGIPVSGSVEVSNLNEPHGVSGTVDVGNLANPHPISGTVIIGSGSVEVSNLNEPHGVSGTVDVGNLANPHPISGTVIIGSGSVEVSNLNEPHGVSGTVDVGNLGNPHPISGAVTITSGSVTVANLDDPHAVTANITQIAGTAIATGNGTNTGTQRVTIANDNDPLDVVASLDIARNDRDTVVWDGHFESSGDFTTDLRFEYVEDTTIGTITAAFEPTRKAVSISIATDSNVRGTLTSNQSFDVHNKRTTFYVNCSLNVETHASVFNQDNVQIRIHDNVAAGKGVKIQNGIGGILFVVEAHSGFVNVGSASFNIDVFDGTGASGITINWLAQNVHVIEFSESAIKYGISYMDTVYWGHSHDFGNGLKTAALATPMFVEYKIEATPTNTAFVNYFESVMVTQNQGQVMQTGKKLPGPDRVGVLMVGEEEQKDLTFQVKPIKINRRSQGIVTDPFVRNFQMYVLGDVILNYSDTGTAPLGVTDFSFTATTDTYVGRMIIQIQSGSSFDIDGYADIGDELDVGISLWKLPSGGSKEIYNAGYEIKSNGDWIIMGYDVTYHDFGSGKMLAVRSSFNKSGGFIKLSDGDAFGITVNDDFTDLTHHRFVIQYAIA